MAALVSLANLCLGVAFASQAPRQPTHAAAFETAAGLALVTGLALIGIGLRAVH